MIGTKVSHVLELAELGRRGPLVLDIETTGLTFRDRIDGVGIWPSADPSRARYVLWDVFAEAWGTERQAMSEGIFRHDVLHNALFDLSLIGYKLGWGPSDWRHIHAEDSMFAAKIAMAADGEMRSAKLDDLARDLDPEHGKLDAMRDWLAANGCQPWEYVRAPLPLRARYCLRDCEITWKVRNHWVERCARLQADGTYAFECECIPMVCEMYATGLRVDTDYAVQAMDMLSMERNTVLGALKKHADICWSANSKGLERYLQSLGIELIGIPKRDKKKNAWVEKLSFDKDARAMYRDEYPEHAELFDMIDRYQRTQKLLADYKTLVEKQVDGRIHSRFNQLGARTGRGSSSDPNFQNIARPEPWEPEHYNLKNAILADEGTVAYTADFSQAEMRQLLHHIRCFDDRIQRMIDLVEEGEDLHTATASMMYRIPIDEVDDTLRKKGKTMNFAKIYGQGTRSMAKNLGVTPEEAKVLEKLYFDGLPGMDVMLKELKRAARRRGRIRTSFGRIIGVPKDRLYVALNYLCQGAVGEGTKRAMLEIWKMDREPGHRILFQVHDDVPQCLPSWLEQDERRKAEVLGCVREAMLKPWEGLKIKFDVDIKGPRQTWGGRAPA